MEKEKNKTASWLKGHVYDVAAYAGLVITIILFLIFSGDKLMYNATTVLQTVAPYAIISLGAVFVYSMGFMDVSVGQQVGVYAILYILISNKMGGTTAGVAVAFIVVLAIALACGAFNGAVPHFGAESLCGKVRQPPAFLRGRDGAALADTGALPSVGGGKEARAYLYGHRGKSFHNRGLSGADRAGKRVLL